MSDLDTIIVMFTLGVVAGVALTAWGWRRK